MLANASINIDILRSFDNSIEEYYLLEVLESTMSMAKKYYRIRANWLVSKVMVLKNKRLNHKKTK